MFLICTFTFRLKTWYSSCCVLKTTSKQKHGTSVRNAVMRGYVYHRKFPARKLLLILGGDLTVPAKIYVLPSKGWWRDRLLGVSKTKNSMLNGRKKISIYFSDVGGQPIAKQFCRIIIRNYNKGFAFNWLKSFEKNYIPGYVCYILTYVTMLLC